MDRRDFMKVAAMTAAGAGLLESSCFAEDARPKDGNQTNIRNFHPEMQYRLMGKTGVMISALGFGMLRLPMLDDGKTVDEAKTIEMLRYGIDNGINYVDTARGYLGGQSEAAVGKALSDGYREKVYLATKLTLQAMKSEADFERMFDESRKALHTDVFDFYLLHHVTHNTWHNSVIPFKVLEKAQKYREEGKIRFLGFSWHDSLPFFQDVLNAIPDWDFCQLMENYVDTQYEAGFLGMKYAYDRGMAVNCMEPLKAGLLANPPEEVRKILDSSPNKRPVVEWAFDYLWDMPYPGVVISGMSNIDQVRENLAYARKSSINMLDWDDRMTIGKAALRYRQYPGVTGCTGCDLCVPCPQNVAIGSLIGNMWFIYKVNGNKKAAQRYYNHVPPQRGVNANACNDCSVCLPKCPEQVNIPEILRQMRNELNS